MTDLVPVGLPAKVAQGLEDGSLSLKELLDALKPHSVVDVPPSLPVPRRRLTADQIDAMQRLPDLFARVVPDRPRLLATSEVSQLREEVACLKHIAKMAKERTDDVRTTVLNHANRLAEEDGTFGDALKEKDGHAVLSRDVMDDSGKGFKLVATKPTGHLSELSLKALELDASVPEFTHQDYLAMTRPERVLDDHLAMVHLRKRPDLVEVLTRARVVTATSPSIAFKQG